MITIMIILPSIVVVVVSLHLTADVEDGFMVVINIMQVFPISIPFHG